MIQSVLLSKDVFTRKQAFDWIKKHNFKVDTKPANFETTNYYRFRQARPLTKYRYRMKEIAKGVYFVLAY